MTTPKWKIDPAREAEAARALRESLIAMYDADEELIADTIEGETGLFELIDHLLARRRESEIMVAGLDDVINGLKARKARYERLIDGDRALIEQAMMIAELPKIERPTATLSLSNRAPKVEVQTESDIPAEFWKAAAPTLDRKALLDALKAGRPVPGACLSNAAPSLTVRVK